MTIIMSIGFLEKENASDILSNILIYETKDGIILDSIHSRNNTLIKPKNYVCPASNSLLNTVNHTRNISKRSSKNLMILTRSSTSELQSNLAKLLHSTRIKFHRSYYIDLTSTRTSIILFENYTHYQMGLENSNFTSYLLENRIGVIVFNTGTENSEKLNEDTFLKDFLHITKYNTQYLNINKTIKLNRAFKNLFLKTENYNLKSILQCETSSNTVEDILFVNKINGIKHVFISIDNLDDIWLLKSLFIDALRYLTDGDIEISLDRYVQIDIDDIFVADSGTRMIPNDVYELIRLQDELSTRYFYHDDYKFKFNLGYSGYYYQSGDKYEDEADRLLIGIKPRK